MKKFRTIWRHEVRQVDRIVKALLEHKKVVLDWTVILLPIFLNRVYQYRKSLRETRKNMLYTRQFAFDAAKNISQGKDQAWEVRRIEIKTQEVLEEHKKGFYTEKIRRKQLAEIELLIKHYLDLFSSEQSTYTGVIKDRYPSKGNYLAFLNTLQKAEEEVIQAAITSMRKGSKKERRQWFQKVKETTKKIRAAEAEEIYT
ncbi:MAG: NF038143 family protein [Desulfobacterales bacterium]|nr:NF038143 family protein [Desulfobacterales bacterium]